MQREIETGVDGKQASKQKLWKNLLLQVKKPE